MYDIYLKRLEIDKVRHIKNISIDISKDCKRNLIVTGKNGSGKTSLLDALSIQLDFLSKQGDLTKLEKNISLFESKLDIAVKTFATENQISEILKKVNYYKEQLAGAKAGLNLTFSVPESQIKSHFEKGEFVLAYYGAKRVFNALVPEHVEKVTLKDSYGIRETPRNEFLKYILDLKMTEALANNSGKKEKAQSIHKWFDSFESLLKEVLEDNSTKLLFDEDTFKFSLHQDNRETFDFQTLSDGYAAILDIVVDLIVRMEKHVNGVDHFTVPGIVLIDEIETHLHLELQRKIWGFLTRLFPNIQFIVSTHSPIILSNADNATIYDLENKKCISNGLSNLPYEGIIKGYFEVDDLSQQLRSKFDRYKEIVTKKELSDEEIAEIPRLELYLDEIPDYLALEITTEYRRLKADFEKREDL